MAPLVTYQSDGTASVWIGISQALADALNTATKISDQAGNPLSLQNFQGGFLVNGCPLNVWFGQGWLPGQQDALQQAGIISCLPTTNVTSSNTQPTQTQFRCYYEDGSIIVSDTCEDTNDNGSPLLKSELSIIQDVNATTPSSMWLLAILVLIMIASKKKG